MKKCSHCQQTKIKQEFCKNSSTKDGFESICKQCRHEYYLRIKDHRKKYVQENRDKIRKQYWINKEHKDLMRKIWTSKNKDRIKKHRKRSYENTKNNPIRHLIHNIRSMISGIFSRRNTKKSLQAYQILGCSFEEALGHLILTAIHNYGFYDTEIAYEIDHIIPISMAKTPEDVIKLNHISNLQFLTREDNRLKWDRLDWRVS